MHSECVKHQTATFAPSKVDAGAPKSRFHVHRWCKVITVTKYFTFIKNLIIARSKAMITEQSDGGVRGHVEEIRTVLLVITAQHYGGS